MIPPSPTESNASSNSGSVLVTGGGKDEFIPPAHAVDQVGQRARTAGHTNVVRYVYPQAGHVVGCIAPNLPIITQYEVAPKIYGEIGGTAEANEEAAAVAWPRLMRFLATLSG